MLRVYLYLSDIEKMKSCSRSSASRYYSTIKAIVGKSRWQRLTVWDYSQVERIPIAELITTLKLEKK